MRHMAVAAFAAIDAITVTGELAAPALLFDDNLFERQST